MRLLIAAVGKLKQGPERDLFAHYLGRAEAAGRRLHLSPLNFVEVAESRAATASVRMKAEAEALLGKIPASHKLVALDPGGRAVSSEDFARLLAQYRDQGVEGIALLIGGADGLARDMLDKAAKVISLGSVTFPHGLARIVLAEQIYRAATILQGHPYHRGGKGQG
jgi:23S rRNA (pseudouridine1915-N3)-methyltransferase